MGRLPELAPGERRAAVAAAVVAVLVLVAGLLAVRASVDSGRPHRPTVSEVLPSAVPGEVLRGHPTGGPTTATSPAQPAAVQRPSTIPAP